MAIEDPIYIGIINYRLCRSNALEHILHLQRYYNVHSKNSYDRSSFGQCYPGYVTQSYVSVL